MNCSQLRQRINSTLGEYQHACTQSKREEAALVEIRQHISNVETAQKISQVVVEAVQKEAHQQISEVVSSCLEAVFEEDAYQFKIDFVQRRGKTEADLFLEREGLVVDPLKSAGGGVVDVVSFALRLACLLLRAPKVRSLLVLDEPFKMLSKEYVPLVGQLLLRLAKEHSVQIIMVTHNPQLQIGKVIDIDELKG